MHQRTLSRRRPDKAAKQSAGAVVLQQQVIGVEQDSRNGKPTSNDAWKAGTHGKN
jgi:hypothetical protein